MQIWACAGGDARMQAKRHSAHSNLGSGDLAHSCRKVRWMPLAIQSLQDRFMSSSGLLSLYREAIIGSGGILAFYLATKMRCAFALQGVL